MMGSNPLDDYGQQNPNAPQPPSGGYADRVGAQQASFGAPRKAPSNAGAVIVLLVLLLAGGGAGFYFWSMSRKPNVMVVNGTPVEVSVSIGDQSVTVAPQQYVQIEHMNPGPYHIATTANGAEIESLDVDIEPGTDGVVYNVAGAATVLASSVTFFTNSAMSLNHEEDIELFPGERFITREDADYIFE
ncbi:MAG: hypothetical protein KC561_11410, partial [Myxococcales bacterium]|nr:hypothetical protein [Myxococcales bacterium]